jgi:hypothetical protein
MTQIKPSLWHCLWGVPFFLIGVGFFVYTLFQGLTHATDSLTQIVVPGSAELNLRPGLYTVFLEEETTVNGKIYSTTQSVAGLTCRVNSVQNGAAISIGRPGGNTTYSVNGRSGHSVLEFSIQQNGRYSFACDYGDSPRGADVVVAVGSGVGEAITRTVFVGLASFFGGIFAGLIPLAMVLTIRQREKKRLVQSGQALS